MSGVCGGTFFGPSPWGHGEGSKVNYQIRKVNFKDFIPNFTFVLKIKEMGFSLCRLGHTSGGGTWGCLWVIFPPKHGRVAYQIEGDGEQNGERSMVKLVTLRYSQ